MTVEEAQKKFAVMVLTRWKRLAANEEQTSPRPHLVPLDSEAEGFVDWQRNLKVTDPNTIFGKFYTGFGSAVIGDADRWTQVFRFIAMTENDAVNAFINIARVYPAYLASRHDGSTEKMEKPKEGR